MRHHIYIIFLTISALGSSSEIVETDGTRYKVTPEIALQQQKLDELMLDKNPKLLDWNIQENEDLFKNQTILDGFMEYYQRGLLSKNNTFNIHDPSVMDESVKIVDLLYFTKDFDSFYKVAKWLAGILNREQFTYAVAVVVLHRPDIHLSLPPWYQVFPNYFVTQSSIRTYEKRKKTEMEPISVEEVGMLEELKYFRWDPDLNSLYYNWFLNIPNWMSGQKYGGSQWIRKGELFHNYHDQIVARYDLECYANNLRLPAILDDLNSTIRVGYETDMKDSVGNQMVNRPPDIIPTSLNNPLLQPFSDSFNKIKQALRDGNIVMPDNTSLTFDELGLYGTVFLSDIMYNTTGSVNPSYYGSFYDFGIGFLASLGKEQQLSGMGSIGNPMTALRDPLAYSFIGTLSAIVRVNKYIHLFPYRIEDLEYPGVKIESFQTGRLETFFDNFSLNVTNLEGLDTGSFQFQQKRLNHEPFTVRLNITNTNNSTEGAMVRIFIGPPLNQLKTNAEHNRHLMVEIDRFPVRLDVGENIIERNSSKSTVFVENDEINQNEVYTKSVVACGFPGRLMLPRGGTGKGTPFSLVAVASSFFHVEGVPGVPEEETFMDNFVLCGGQKFADQFPMGYPFDRRILNITVWEEASNIVMREEMVFHRE